MKLITKFNKLISRKCIYGKYATDEEFTGDYWVDGKKIYRKVLVGKTASSSTSATLGTINNKDTIVGISGIIQPNSGTTRQLPWPNGSNSTTLNVTTSGVVSVYNTTEAYYSKEVIAIVSYTKTTD